jgi:Flp pilus assembly protein TadB
VTPLLADASATALAAALAGLAAALATAPHAAKGAPSVLRGRRREDNATPARGSPSRTGPQPQETRVLLPAAALAGFGAWALLGGLVGVIAGAGVAGAVIGFVPRLETRSVRLHRERMAADLPLGVDLLAACLAAGRPPDQALGAVCSAVGGPLATELGVVSVRLRLGADPVGLWRDVARHPSPLTPLGRTMARSIETGAPVVDGLRLLAADLRRHRRATTEQRARQVAVRAAAPLGLCFLPAFVLVGVVPAVVEAFAALSW